MARSETRGDNDVPSVPRPCGDVRDESLDRELDGKPDRWTRT